MAKVNNGRESFIGGAARLLHTGSGSVVALVVSNPAEGAQTITFYDGLSSAAPVLLRLAIPAGCAPFCMDFSAGNGLHFTDGLTIDPGGCDLHATTIA